MIDTGSEVPGYNYTAYLHTCPIGGPDLNWQMIEDMLPPCLDVCLRKSDDPFRIAVDCRDEATCIAIALTFHPHYDGHVMVENGKVIELSPPVRSTETAVFFASHVSANDN